MASGFRKRVRGDSVAYILLGALICFWGWWYTGSTWSRYVPILSARYQIGETVGGVGAFIMGWGFVRLFRHKGDYDDFEDPGEPRVR